MKMLFLAFFLAAALNSGLAFAQTPADQDNAALAAATKWLALCDAGRYPESWQNASSFFRGAVAEKDWDAALAGVRTPLGAATSRTVKSAKSATSLPGAPDGNYVVMTFDTVFANKKAAVETVTFMQDKDGSWRAAGYFIR
ncbi:DUF4019 domain-containing protein [Desulfovibrio sp. TomC]|uniref:DUF4019 domain-containing protein n=1 Tax=Desulfovibrio sp. TomC TaxID=1562888 RepID=UPI000573A864|nr:DUF4019 domain-containing protein [Desulfovibrio sp. TomC]KHK02027.1 hypothetical protein NY78_2511 [Desulfovibrio sp. TomC]